MSGRLDGSGLALSLSTHYTDCDERQVLPRTALKQHSLDRGCKEHRLFGAWRGQRIQAQEASSLQPPAKMSV